MRTFDYEKLAELHWDNEVLRHVAKIHEYKGRLAKFADRNRFRYTSRNPRLAFRPGQPESG